MTPQHFIAKWGPGGPAFHLNEEQGAQSHFLDLCELLDVPKGRELTTVSQEEIDLIMDRLNHRPRKRLGFKTPHQVFIQSLNRVAIRR